jgi:hypothetical protein
MNNIPWKVEFAVALLGRAAYADNQLGQPQLG